MFAPFTEVTEPGHENTFFSFGAANSDGFQHFKQIAPNFSAWKTCTMEGTKILMTWLLI